MYKAIGLLLLAMVLLVSGAAADGKSAFTNDFAKVQAFNELKKEVPGVKSYKSGEQVTRLYGKAFGYGSTPKATVDAFISDHIGIFGIESSELIPNGPGSDKTSAQPVMYIEETGEYKFYLYEYKHEINGIPVFGSKIKFLVRNEANNPLVLVSSSIHELGEFVPDYSKAGVQSNLVLESIRSSYPSLTDFSEQETVIYAGVNSKREEPRMAVKIIGTSDFPEKYVFVVDINNGDILYEESQIIFEDVDVEVDGNVTQGLGSEQCEEELPELMPYLRVNIGSEVEYTDKWGNATISNSGTGDVVVQAQLWGTWFRVHDYGNNEEVLVDTVTPPGPVEFLFNEANNDEEIRSQANCYREANLLRDMVLTFNPSYPGLSENEFPIYTNRTDGYCPGNAWYDSGEESMNFCSSGDGHPNTGWSSVIHHEYGHHLVNRGGSGQGQYGEGLSDCMAMLMVDDPRLGLGFFGSCSQSLRTADNNHQYPCSGGIHDCGQLLSGCVWDTRNALVASNNRDYLAILKNLTINSILLHSGTEITPQITIDFLTLDDDDADIGNGTPHYYEIATGFGAHNMDAPELDLLSFSYPNGRPATIYPNQPETTQVVVTGIGSTVPLSGSGVLYYSVDGGSYTSIPMIETATNEYNAIFPAFDCNAVIDYYFEAQTDDSQTDVDPEPGLYYRMVVATDVATAFYDDFESDLGWTISGGNWARGTPTGGGGDHGSPDPSGAYEGSNVMGYNLSGDYENNMPERHATTPAFDCSGMSGTTLKFMRWLGVERPAYDHAYVRISTNGTTWNTLWENSAEVNDAAWVPIEIDISSYADGQATVYLRWTMGTTDGSWRYCGWNIDNVEVSAYSCEANPVLQITTESLPDWTAGVAYSQQLTAENGVGNLTWTDKNNDLNGTGLTLSTDGLLSGTPSANGTISFTAQVEDEGGAKSIAEKTLGFDVNVAVQITTASVPDWTSGHPMSTQLQSSGGTGGNTWSDHNGDLSGSGLTLSAAGLLSGTPSTAGETSFTARATDQVGSTHDVLFTFTINDAIAITATDLPDWTSTLAYSQQLEATGGTGTLSFADKNNDLNGTGLTLNAAGLLSGTPSAGSVSFTAEVTDEVGATQEYVFGFTVNPAVAITTTTLPDWTIDMAYSESLVATGGTGELTWSDKYSDLSGKGLALTSDGTLSGTPTEAGDITFTAIVSDELSVSHEQEYTFTINAAVAISAVTLPDWTVGIAYSEALSATGGTGDLTWIDMNSDLATTGLTLASDGTLSGTPSTDGPISFTAEVSDAVGDTEEQAFGFTVNPAVEITTASLPDGIEGDAYSQQLAATGGTGSLTWLDLNDDLSETGLTLGTDGLLSGAPSFIGELTFTAQAADNVGSVDTQAYTFEITPAFLCGDADDDGEFNLIDILYTIDYVYNNGIPPVYLDAVDVNSSGEVDLLDILDMIDNIYGEGVVLNCP